jgi:hypothetical protein
MTGQKLKEFIQRLQAEGYEPRLDEHGAGTVRDGEQSIRMIEDGEIQFKREYRPLAMSIKKIRDEVDEYMTAYLAAAPDAAHLKDSSKLDTRTLLLFNSVELVGRQAPDRTVDFVTWQHDRNSERENGHYLTDYTAAKQDFAVRAGLVDRDRLFTETELTVIRSNLSDYLTIDGGDHVSWEQEDSIKEVIEKIDNIIVPEINTQAQEAEEEGYDPENEL